MSSGGQIFGAVAGGIVGFVGSGANPAGALKGAAYGASIGAALDPPPGPDIEGPRIDDNAEQTSSYGAGVSTIDGKIAVKGTWIWIENNKKKIIAKKEDSGGGKSGGGGSETTTYEAFVTGCILLTDHQIDGIERLWFSSDLVANTLTSDVSTAVASSELFPTASLQRQEELLKASLSSVPESGTIRLYPGFDDQPVDPRMEADLGAGNCPAYRGYALLFLYDYPLKDYSNSIAGLQAKAECIKSGQDDSLTYLDGVRRDHFFTDAFSYGVCNYLEPDEAYSFKAIDANVSAFLEEDWSLDAVYQNGQNEYLGPLYKRSLNEGRTDSKGSWSRISNTWDFLPSAASFHSASGRYREKNGIIYGSCFAGSDLGIYRFASGSENYIHLAAGNRVGLDADNNGNLFTITISPPTVEKYDEDLVLVDSLAITLTPTATIEGRKAWLCWDNGIIYIIAGQDGRYVYAMSDDLSSDPVYLGDAGAALFTTEAATNCTIKNGILSRYTTSKTEHAVERWRLPAAGDAGQSLASVTRERLERSELIEPADIDVTLLTGNVSYATSGISSVRSTVSPLMSAYNFDIQPHGYQSKCIPRGQSSVMTIDYDDLDARPFGSAPGIAIDHQREMDTQLPKQLLVDFIDAGRNYNRNQESSFERIGSDSVNKESYELPFVFTPDEAAELASTQMDRRWLERDDFAFVLPQTYNRLEAADVVDIVTPYATYEWRLTSVNLLADGRVECTAKLNDSAIYTQNATGGTRVEGDTTISFAGKSIMHLLDIPLIRDEDNKPGFAGSLCGKSSGWPGGTIIRSVDSGQTFQALQGFVGGVTSGICSDSLPAHDGYVIDRTNTLTINLYNSSMSLSSITEAQMLTGKHWAAYGVAGRWELIQFANATLNADDSYTIDTLVRGAKGTEQYTDDHVDGDIFILLADADAAFIAANVSDIGVERIYRGVTTGKDIDTVVDTNFTYSGVNLKPPSVVHVEGSIDGSNNWDVSYVPRSRLSTSEWSTGVDIPVGEATESYENDIMDGSTVVRTITSTSPDFQYTSADQVTDWGSNQSTITVNIYKMSAIVGRGYVTEITL
jgi:hypothetical protein